jgi:hypothetical protein
MASAVGITFFGCYSLAVLLGMMTKPALSGFAAVPKFTNSPMV